VAAVAGHFVVEPDGPESASWRCGAHKVRIELDSVKNTVLALWLLPLLTQSDRPAEASLGRQRTCRRFVLLMASQFTL